MARSRGYEVGVGCLLVAAAGVLAFMALQVGALSTLGQGTVVTARFLDAAGLDEGAAVSVAGVQVGVVERLELDHDAAIVHMRLEEPVGKDAKVRIRSRSLLGEKYVEVVPGVRGVPPVAEGDALVAVGDQVEPDELLAMLAPVLEGIDPELVAEVMGKLSQRLEEDPELVSRMLGNADRMLANAAAASDELPVLVADSKATIAQGRRTLGAIEDRAQEGEEVLARADRVLADVEVVSKGLPGLVANVDATVGDARAIVGQMKDNGDQIELILNNLSEIDKWELRRLLREEGILVRLRRSDVDPEAEPKRKKGKNE